MTDKIFLSDGIPGQIVHLNARKKRENSSVGDEPKSEVEIALGRHFREQNTLLRDQNNDLASRLNRLSNGIERLVEEMHGVRTGKKEEAFARVGGSDCSPDLPTVCAESALLYTETSTTIGNFLGFHASQIGLLLGPQGLNWAGNGDFQEIGRSTNKGITKFWHRDVPGQLQRVLNENNPQKYGITKKSVLSIFKKWKISTSSK